MLPLFPHATLETSLFTAVLVGLLVLWFFQETLGWGFSGLVVPGYLASVTVVQPATGGMIAGEALLTYLIFVAASESVPRRWPWTPLFGRDRFLGILLSSVAVRLGVEGAVLPAIETALGWTPAAGLHSLGLVLVPLLANALWRSGLIVGLPRVGVPVLITWAALRFVLLGNTNLSLEAFELTYEDLALNFVGSPRAYILILTGSWIASQANLKWGWDYGGILIPGLLTLCWLAPHRLLATLAEALVIAGALSWLTRRWPLRGLNLTGGRPLVLGFALAWTARFVLGWALGSRWMGLRTHDLFGFGYLLPTLLALRVAKQGSPFQALIPTVLVSLAGFLGGTGLGYLLYVALPPERGAAPPEPVAVEVQIALQQAARTGQGPLPEHVEALVRAGQPGLWTGGFGGLWVRGGANPLTVAVQGGALGLSSAAVEIAALLDATAVLVCSPSQNLCRQAVSDLELAHPVLWVASGERSALAARGAVPDGLDLSALDELIGDFQVQPAGRGLTLVLSEQAALRAAAGRVPVSPGPLADGLAPLRGAVDGAASGSTPRDPASLGWLNEEVLAPLEAWRARRLPDGPLLSMATRGALRLGLRLGSSADQVALAGPDWRLVLDRSRAGPVVQVPQAEDELGTEALGSALFLGLEASALVVDSPPSAPVAGGRAQRAAQVALLSALAASPAGTPVLSVRGVRDVFDPGADAVLALGRPMARPEQLSPALARLAELAPRLGYSAAWMDGGAARLSFLDPGNTARYAAAAAAAESQLTLFATAPLLGRAAPLDLGQPWEPSLRALPRVTVEARALVEAAASTPPASAAWQGLLDRASMTAGMGSAARWSWLSGEAARLDARAAVACDPLLGCRWLLVAPTRAGDDPALLIPLGAAWRPPHAPAPDLSPAMEVALGARPTLIERLEETP